VDTFSNAALPAGIQLPTANIVAVRPVDNQAVRKLQASLEDITTNYGRNRRWSAIYGDLTAAVLSDHTSKLLASQRATRQAKALISDLQTGITDLRRLLTPRIKNKLSLGERSYLI